MALAVGESKRVSIEMSKLVKVKLTNQIGMEVTLINFGARIASVKYPVIDKLKEMLVSYDKAEDFVTDPYYLGATCGRVSNRIAQGQFKIGDTSYQLPINNGEHTLHGGVNNASLQYWQIDEDSLSSQKAGFNLTLPDGQDGFPGTVTLNVVYELDDSGALTISYTANTDQTTPINLTNHAYFHLGEKTCFDLQLKLATTSFLERGADGIPTGEILPIETMGVDFGEGYSLTELVDLNKYQQVKQEAGFDSCFVLNPDVVKKAELRSKINRVKLTLETDQPTVQLYTGKFLGAPFKPYQGVCLESQDYVDAPNHSHFPSIMLSPNETYRRKIVYRFSAY